jgi:hypothetical protein
MSDNAFAILIALEEERLEENYIKSYESTIRCTFFYGYIWTYRI